MPARLEYTAEGGGGYQVYVGGEATNGYHVAEREAAEEAGNLALARPDAEVWYEPRPHRVRVVAIESQPAPAPAPEPASEPVSVWFEEDWSGYVDTAALISDPRHDTSVILNDGGAIELASGLTTPWGGTKAVRRRIAAPAPTQVGMRVELPDADAAQVQEMWQEMWLNTARWSQGAGDKTLFVQVQDYERWTLMELGVTGGPIAVSGHCPALDADNPFGNPFWRKAWPAPDAWLKADFEGHPEWRQLRFHCKLGPGVPTGGVKISVDGVLAYVADDGSVTQAEGDYIKYIQLGANGSGAEGAEMLYGRIRVYDEDPGWTEFA